MSDPKPSEEQSLPVWSKPEPRPPAGVLVEVGGGAPAPRGAGQPLQWLVIAGVVLLALGSAVLGHVQAGRQRQRTDDLVRELDALRQDRARLELDLMEQTGRIRRTTVQRHGQLGERLAALQQEQGKASQLGVDLLAKLLAFDGRWKKLQQAQEAEGKRLAALERQSAGLLPRADFDSKWAWLQVHLARRAQVEQLKAEFSALRKGLDAGREAAGRQDKALAALRRSIERKADAEALRGKAAKADLDGLARKEELARYAHKNDMVGLASGQELKKLEATLRVLGKGIQHMLDSQQKLEQRFKALEQEVARLKKG